MTPSSVLSAKACNIGSGRARYYQLFKLFRGTKPPFLFCIISRASLGVSRGRVLSWSRALLSGYTVPPSPDSDRRGVRRSRRPFVTPVTVQ